MPSRNTKRSASLAAAGPGTGLALSSAAGRWVLLATVHSCCPRFIACVNRPTSLRSSD